MDPDYAPHLYDDKDDPKVVKGPTAADLATVKPEVDETDHRVRTTAGNFRVVMPDGRQKGRRFFVNNSSVVIEQRSKDARGVEKWDRVTSFSKPGPRSDKTEVDFALYWLLAGPDAE